MLYCNNVWSPSTGSNIITLCWVAEGTSHVATQHAHTKRMLEMLAWYQIWQQRYIYGMCKMVAAAQHIWGCFHFFGKERGQMIPVATRSASAYVAHEQSDPAFTLGSIIYMHTCILYILWSDLIMQSKQTRQLYLCSLYLLLPLLQREFIFYFKWSKQEKRWQGLSSLDMLFLWGSSERRPCWWCFKSHWGVLMEKWW